MEVKIFGLFVSWKWRMLCKLTHTPLPSMKEEA